MTPLFKAEVHNGKLVFEDRVAFDIWLDQFKEREELDVIVRRPRKMRSLPQNDRYWGLVLPTIAEATGSTKEELHEVFKRMFLTPRIISYRGKEVKIPGSTATLTTKEFTDYLERISAEAAELGITIPDDSQVEV